jgi:MFS family permease
MLMTQPESSQFESNRQLLWLMLASAGILMITMAVRQTTGLYLRPITQSTGVSVVAMSLALAVGQFMFGAAQPVFGAIADKYGSVKVIAFGAMLMALGNLLAPLLVSPAGLLVTMGIFSAAGTAAGSFSILIGGVAQRLPPERRSFAAGFINAGGSLGQVIAPAVQMIIGAAGWMTAMYVTAAAALLTIPLALPLRQKQGQEQSAVKIAALAPISLSQQIADAMRDRSYLLLHLGFFTCGFHIAFLVTHLPSDLQLCGLTPGVAANSIALIGAANVVGSLGTGWLGQRYRMKSLLALIYASRAAIVAVYLVMPKTAVNVYIFAIALGVTWLATVPPTSGIVSKLFGTRYLGTLFGLTLVSHQVGGFLGAWLGGIVLAQHGSYDWIWYADIALALLAAVANLPIREAKILPRAVTA